MYHYLGGNVGELLGVLACDIHVGACVTGSGIVAELVASADRVLCDKLDAMPDSGVEVAAAPANRDDDGCARLTFWSCSEVSAPVLGCFATIYQIHW